MYGTAGQILGQFAEGLSFQGDQSFINPMRYLPDPARQKLGAERTPFEAYLNNEVVGTRMRRWERPVHDFLMPYARGAVKRATGIPIIASDVQKRRDLNTLADVMAYLVSPSCRTPKHSRAGAGDAAPFPSCAVVWGLLTGSDRVTYRCGSAPADPTFSPGVDVK